MLQQTQKALTTAPAELLGDLRPLLEQIGRPSSPADGDAAFVPQQIDDLAQLRSFLRSYHSRILQPLELPAIQRAFVHATRNESRELIEFDHQISHELSAQGFASASREVGHVQLQRLRPLRDERVVQRYLAAVEQGHASGWHTLVYGLTLAVFSLPLRQGLLIYAQQTTHALIQSASRTLGVAEADRDMLFSELSADFPAQVDALLSRSSRLKNLCHDGEP